MLKRKKDSLSPFDIFNNKEAIITINKGPQFKSKGTYILALISITFVILSVASFIKEDFYLSLLFFVIGFISFFYVLDIHGIQLDRNLNCIRDYKLILGIKIGKWQNFNNFKSIYLTKDQLTISTKEYGENSKVSFHYYFIKLVDEVNGKEITLSEFTNYYKAFTIAKNVAETNGLQFKNKIINRKKE